jgi:hypothetical protein
MSDSPVKATRGSSVFRHAQGALLFSAGAHFIPTFYMDSAGIEKRWHLLCKLNEQQLCLWFIA